MYWTSDVEKTTDSSSVRLSTQKPFLQTHSEDIEYFISKTVIWNYLFYFLLTE